MPSDLAFDHRRRQLAVRAGVLARLTRLARLVDVADLSATVVPFAEAAAAAVNEGFRLSSRTAGLFYLAARPAGITTLQIPEVFPPVEALVANLLRGAMISGIQSARRGGRDAVQARANGLVRVAGSASNVVLSGGRQTVLQTAAEDPAATGRWQRVASPTACRFCLMLADRGPVYRDVTGDFASHDNCGCSVEPEFSR